MTRVFLEREREREREREFYPVHCMASDTEQFAQGTIIQHGRYITTPSVALAPHGNVKLAFSGALKPNLTEL